MFNSLIFNDLAHADCCIVPILGLEDLCDNTGFLARGLSFDGDAKHVNRSGARILAQKIKRALHLRKVNGGFNNRFNRVVAGRNLWGRVT